MQGEPNGGLSWQEMLGGIAAVITAVAGGYAAMRSGSEKSKRNSSTAVERSVDMLSRVIDDLREEVERIRNSRNEETERADRYERESRELRSKVYDLEELNKLQLLQIQALTRKVEQEGNNIRIVAEHVGVDIDTSDTPADKPSNEELR